ncbi:MAG: urease accessory protein UreF, partial [Moorea sp. SIO3C2]|nr:urease accessory protein UreF [Moorena sp. SIO3C2]
MSDSLVYSSASVETLPLLLQIASPTLPVGAYSYSEGIEWLVDTHRITTANNLEHWIRQELQYGTMRLDAAVMVRIYQAQITRQTDTICHWNQWLSAIRDTKELREQSWQMGQALVRLVHTLEPGLDPLLDTVGQPCNFATVFSITAAHWGIDLKAALMAYLHSWLTNMVNAGIKLIPIGQTSGQSLMLKLYPTLRETVHQCIEVNDDE